MAQDNKEESGGFFSAFGNQVTQGFGKWVDTELNKPPKLNDSRTFVNSGLVAGNATDDKNMNTIMIIGVGAVLLSVVVLVAVRR